MRNAIDFLYSYFDGNCFSLEDALLLEKIIIAEMCESNFAQNHNIQFALTESCFKCTYKTKIKVHIGCIYNLMCDSRMKNPHCY